jgi:hypothetical protein
MAAALKPAMIACVTMLVVASLLAGAMREAE